MPAYTRSIYHVVFGTKGRRRTLTAERRRDFLAYSCGIIKGMDSHVYRINCVEDHLHILAGLHPTLAVSTFVKRFKISSGNWIRQNGAFPLFDHWQE